MERTDQPVTCFACGAPLLCDPAGDCWCMAMPRHFALPEDPNATCLCPGCLNERARNRAGRAAEAAKDFVPPP